MERHQVSPENHRRVVLAYHGLPVVTALALVGIFLAVFYFTGNLLLSSLAAAVPSVFLIWRWILAGRQIDRWGCPKCGESLPKKMYWRYPPKVCPRCGERLDR
jgi:ribosomal protein S27AE